MPKFNNKITNILSSEIKINTIFVVSKRMILSYRIDIALVAKSSG